VQARISILSLTFYQLTAAYILNMPYCVVMYVYRKKGTSPEQFKEYYETTHVPCIQRLSGHLFPTSHVRHYIGYMPQAVTSQPNTTGSTGSTGGDHRVEAAFDLLEGSASSPNVPIVVMGQPADFEWDACSIITYTNEIHFREFMAVLTDEGNAKILAEDEERFMDRARFQAVILGDVRQTINDSWEESQNS
jgi:hypothetical protein